MEKITDINQLDLNKIYSYADYLLWKFEERIELIKGRIFKMSPAPSRKHQDISMNLIGEMIPIFKGQKCKMYTAPFDVRFPKESTDNKTIYTVVQPDICIICDENKLDDKGCIGAPDLIVEILSPGNSKKELKNKFELYEEYGVKEYWIVNPLDEVVYVHTLENGKYKGAFPITDDYIHSEVFPEVKIHTDEVFKT
ncbi:Uma2 family endonuclease [Bergeyella zoohelcum]|uniref:Uma2 family endonuclease n=1 Tax=Bergeyella zoohelcum TaxID=1015 RepID=UPI002A918E18|nr:Uma2 family endonuclease [Bergeyella zoohelcum]MDY6025521.1 Uma2 family endonuclease [Bergeyella zoohelcum]